MRKTLALGALPLLALAACAAPNRFEPSTQGVGFGDYDAYLAQQAAPATGFAAPAATPYGMGPQPGVIPSAALAAAGIGVAGAPPVATATFGAPPAPGVLGAPAAPGSMVTVASSGVAGDVNTLRSTGLEASPSNAAPMLVGAVPTATPTVPQTSGTGISDEQDFDAVASRESIESDAARRAAQAAQYQVVQPTALPPAPASTGPNIVEYALAAPNQKGQEWYARFVFSGEGRMLRNCNSYANPDDAQRDFLARGGPERDPRGLDPDGDGFACAWDPAPFRAATAAN